jgi:hypothetical protein
MEHRHHDWVRETLYLFSDTLSVCCACIIAGMVTAGSDMARHGSGAVAFNIPNVPTSGV